MGMSFLEKLMCGVAMPFCMDEAGDAGAAGGDGGSAGEGGAAGEGGTATDDGTGGKAGMFGTGGDGGEGGEGGSGEGGAGSDFNALLGEELAKDKGFEKYANAENPVQEMAKSLLEAQKQVGKAKIGVPGENATPEERATFNEAMGVPKEAAGYGFEKPEGVPDEAYDQAHADKWAGILHDNNVPIEAAGALREAMFAEHQESEAAANTALNEKMDAIFGDQKQLIAQQASALMQEAIPDADLRAQIQEAIGNEKTPAFAAALGLVTQHMKKTYGLSDENFGDAGINIGKSAADVRSEAKKMANSPAYMDSMHQDHKETVKTVNAMYKQAGELLDAEAARKK